jgi:Domain of unknown function (DUF4062)
MENPDMSGESKYTVTITGGQGVQLGDGNVQNNDLRGAHFAVPSVEKAPGDAGRPWRVFISHTTELSRYPTDRSFITAARDAVVRTGHVPVEMQTFTAASMPTCQACEERLLSCDVYVGLLGFIWGTAVRDDLTRSYTELEYDTATRAEIPRLVFVVDPQADVAVPRDFWIDEVNGAKQVAFRTKVENDVTRAGIRNPAELETKLYQALTELSTKIG